MPDLLTLASGFVALPDPCSLPWQACASYDRKLWFRVPTSYDADKGVLLIQHTPEKVLLPKVPVVPEPSLSVGPTESAALSFICRLSEVESGPPRHFNELLN